MNNKKYPFPSLSQSFLRQKKTNIEVIQIQLGLHSRAYPLDKVTIQLQVFTDNSNRLATVLHAIQSYRLLGVIPSRCIAYAMSLFGQLDFSRKNNPPRFSP